MDVNTLKNIFNERVKEFGLQEYELAISNGKNTLGSCSYARQVIKISKWHLKGSSEDAILNTLNHELAHALAFKTHGVYGRGHGQKWKEACAITGAKAERNSTQAYTEAKPPSKYTLLCETCNEEYRMHRMGKGRTYICKTCRTKLKVTQHW